MKHFHIRNSLDDIINHRKGEIKLGERFEFLENQTLERILRKKSSVLKYALIGIPESVGIMANQGEAGTENVWQEFLFQISNLQSNRFLEGSEVLCLGQVETKDLQHRAFELDVRDIQYFTKLRSLCQELDQRVAPVIETVVGAGLIPIVIGGGHNNSFPILKGVSKALGLPKGVGCINLDAHADFRPLEGRHSGNGFSYAYYQGFLKRYFVIGLNQQSNSEAMLKNIDLEEGVKCNFYQPGAGPLTDEAFDFLSEEKQLPIGLEVGLDAISLTPASAYSVTGYNLDQVVNFIRQTNHELKPRYLHISEGQTTEASRETIVVGKTIATLVVEFIKTHQK